MPRATAGADRIEMTAAASPIAAQSRHVLRRPMQSVARVPPREKYTPPRISTVLPAGRIVCKLAIEVVFPDPLTPRRMMMRDACASISSGFRAAAAFEE